MPEASKAALQVSIDGLFEGVQVIGRDWTYRYVNRAAARHGRRAVEELVGRTMMECYPGIEQTPLFASLDRVMRLGQPERFRNEFAYPTGETRWFDLHIGPSPDGICVLSIDVTAEQIGIERRRRDAERSEFALRAARMGIWQYWPATHRVHWSRTLEEIGGFEVGQSPTTLDAFLQQVGPEDRELVRQAIQAAVDAPERPFEMEFRLVRPDGDVRWIEGHARAMADPAGRGDVLLGVGIDVTRRRALEAQLQQAQRMEALGQLAGGVAHDFNNVLTQVLGYCDLLLEELGDDPRAADVREIQKAGSQAASLTRDLLAFSRRQIPETRVLDLNAVVTDTARMLARLVGEHIAVDLRLDPALGAVRADPAHIGRLLMNLAANARDAMPDGGCLTVETSNVDLDEAYAATHLSAKPGRHVRLAVSDTGIGMTHEVRARLFEPFFTTKKPGLGTGLGLASVHGIVEQNGGNIWVYSEPGHGTTFKIYLPRVDEVPDASGAALGGADAPLRPATILVVDDTVALLTLTARILRTQDYEVLTAASGDEAIRVAREHAGRIDLLLCDVVMAGESGPVVARALTAVRPELRVVHMSGYTDDAVVRNGVVDTGVRFVQKPFTPDVLLRKVREALAVLQPG